METMNEIIRYKKCLFRETKEHQIEAQLNLPDYYPDVCRILSCRVYSYVENYSMQTDRITAEGMAVIRLLYCSDDKKMHLFESELRFSKSTVTPITAEMPILRCVYKTSSINYRAIGPRRVDVKAFVTLTAELSELTELKCTLPTEDGVEKLLQEQELFDISTCYFDSFVINEDFTLRDERISESKLLHDSSHVYTTEIKSIKDKILIKGYAELNLTYLYSKEQIIFKYTENVPFSQIIDLYGLKESDKCCLLLKPQRLLLSVKDSGECAMSLCVQVQICAGESRIVQITKDLFGADCDVSLTHKKDVLQKNVRLFNDTFQAIAQNEKTETDIAEIHTCYPTEIVYNASTENRKIMLTGKIEVSILLTADDQEQIVSRSVPFEYCREIDSASANEAQLNVICRAVNCTNTSSGLQIKAELEIVGYCMFCETVSFVADYNITQRQQKDDFDTVTLYFAETGESLWDIAKQNRVTIQSIKCMNDMTGDVIENEKVLILLHSEATI